MADTTQELARLLNRVKTARDARWVIGKVLKHISGAYDDLAGISEWKTGLDTKEIKLRLDAIRSTLETQYKALPKTDSFLLTKATLDPIKASVTKALVESAGISGASGKSGDVSLVAELGAGIKSLPADAGKVAGQVVGGAGEIVGKAAGGILGGLGIWGFLLVAVVGLVLFIRVKA